MAGFKRQFPGGGWDNSFQGGGDQKRMRGGMQGQFWGTPDTSFVPEQPAQNTFTADQDFTDDYAAFYGNPERGRGRGSQQRGRGRGQGRGLNTGQFVSNQMGQQQQQQPQTNSQGGGGPPRGAAGQARGGQPRGRGVRGRGRGNIQRGMPPNQFGRGGRGRGNRGNQNFVPPVHSLAKANVSFIDVENMSMAEKLHRFCLFLRNDDSLKINAIQTIMNGITGSKLNLKAEYEVDELMKVSGKSMYTGTVKLSGVFLARSVCPSKKELKQEVFDKALNLMLSKTVAEIYNLVDPGTDAIRAELESSIKKDPTPQLPSLVAKETKDYDTNDVETALQLFIHSIKNRKKTIPDHPISTVDQSTPTGQMLMRHVYNYESVRINKNRTFYMGRIDFGHLVLSRGSALSKKECKYNTYASALDRLLNKSVAELMESVPKEDIPYPVETDEKTEVKAAVKDLPLETRLTELIRTIITLPSKDSSINPIDVAATQQGLTPMLVFTHAKKDDQTVMHCDFYLDRIFITSGEDQRKRDCIRTTYAAVWELLTSTSVETVLTQHRRITDEELTDSSILDVVVKGTGKTFESNVTSLRRFGFDLNALEQRRLEDLVIIEHKEWAKDRFRNAFCILQLSCSQNGMLLQWETQAEDKNMFKCVMSVQKTPVGESYGHNKVTSRALAAADALFKLYETHEVITISEGDDEHRWITWDTIKAAAEKQRAADGGALDPPKLEEGAKEGTKEGTDERKPADPYVLKYVVSKMEALMEAKTREELVFGPGMPLAESREMKYRARQMNLKYDSRQHKGEFYTMLYEKMSWPELATICKDTGRSYGKYIYCKRENVPKHADIAAKIKKEKNQPDPEYVKTEATDVNMDTDSTPSNGATV